MAKSTGKQPGMPKGSGGVPTPKGATVGPPGSVPSKMPLGSGTPGGDSSIPVK